MTFYLSVEKALASGVVYHHWKEPACDRQVTNSTLSNKSVNKLKTIVLEEDSATDKMPASFGNR